MIAQKGKKVIEKPWDPKKELTDRPSCVILMNDNIITARGALAEIAADTAANPHYLTRIIPA